jgi:hypothetical protein
MGVFLRLRHWQVFLLTFGLFLFTIAVVVVDDVSGGAIYGSPDMSLQALLLFQTICLICANFWRYAIGTRLHKKYYYNSLALLIFRWCLYFSTLFNTARFVVFPSIDYFDGSFNMLANIAWLLGGIYCDYFAARMLVSVEQQRDVSFKDFAGDFFAFIFFPLGVWFLQPRINRIFGRHDEVYDPNSPLDQHVRN